MLDFKLNSDSDIYWDVDDIGVCKTFQDATRQSLQTKLRTFKGEWVLDTSYGIDYFGQLLGKGLSQKDTDAVFIAEISNHPDVISINNFSSKFNPYTRFYDMEIDVKSKSGNIVTFLPSVRAEQEITYPDGNTTALQPSCTL
jgi:hypothetical protein